MSTQGVIALISKIKEKTNRLILEEMSQNGIEGIVTSHGDIIYALLKKPKMTMAEIADKIGKDKSTVTSLINKLVKLKYVSKERDTEDARVIYVTLTQEGKKLFPRFVAISKKVLDIFYTEVSEDEQKELVRILNKIYSNL